MIEPEPIAPAELIVVDDLALRRQRIDDAEGIAAAVATSMEELRPWMPWADETATESSFQQKRLRQAVADWDSGIEFGYVIVRGEEVLGCMGLHPRVGPGGLEIGYWVRSDRTRQGIATNCARALTAAALEVGGVTRVEIRCDEANVRSAAIPRRLGYRLDRIETDKITAPAEIGRSMIWVYPP